MYSVGFPRQLPRASLAIVLASAALALGFGVWHYAPQSIFPNHYPGGSTSLVLFAAVLGLMWGWVAHRTGSIRLTAVSHVLLDFSGLSALLYLG